MSDAPIPRFEHAFHRTAERHERIWVFIVVVMALLLGLGTMFYVVLDYGVVTKGVAFSVDPAVQPGFQAGRIVRTGPASMTVYVSAHAWAWTPGVIHVPQGTTVTFMVTSRDVLHGFEVQGTTINLTAVPGIVGSVSYRFGRAGIFHIICNEYCGIEHQAMIGRIIVDRAAGR